MVADEVRTSINSILVMADHVLDSDTTSEQVAQIRVIKTSTEALLALVEEIRDLSKIEAGKLDLDARPFSLVTLVEDADGERESALLLIPSSRAPCCQNASGIPFSWTARSGPPQPRQSHVLADARPHSGWR
jgi:signal transduction histidine kinase